MKEIFKGKWSPKLLVAVLGVVLGVVLMLAGGIGGGGKSEGASGTDARLAEDYREQVEARVRDLCRSVDGVGDVKVMVTVSGGYRYLYAEDSRGECMTVGSGSSERAVVRSVLAPDVVGVGIVCEGARDAALEAVLVDLVSSTLGIGTNRVVVTSGR